MREGSARGLGGKGSPQLPPPSSTWWASSLPPPKTTYVACPSVGTAVVRSNSSSSGGGGGGGGCLAAAAATLPAPASFSKCVTVAVDRAGPPDKRGGRVYGGPQDAEPQRGAGTSQWCPRLPLARHCMGSGWGAQGHTGWGVKRVVPARAPFHGSSNAKGGGNERLCWPAASLPLPSSPPPPLYPPRCTASASGAPMTPPSSNSKACARQASSAWPQGTSLQWR